VPWWLVAAGALLGGGAHLANALPDLEDDLATGVRGLPQRLGPRACAAGAAVLLLAASLCLAAGLGGVVLGAAVVAVAGVALGVGLRAGRSALFRAVVAVALLDVVLLVLGGSALR
jgi:4-hydroxybenzoate polyprenyltransferase